VTQHSPAGMSLRLLAGESQCRRLRDAEVVQLMAVRTGDGLFGKGLAVRPGGGVVICTRWVPSPRSQRFLQATHVTVRQPWVRRVSGPYQRSALAVGCPCRDGTLLEAAGLAVAAALPCRPDTGPILVHCGPHGHAFLVGARGAPSPCPLQVTGTATLLVQRCLAPTGGPLPQPNRPTGTEHEVAIPFLASLAPFGGDSTAHASECWSKPTVWLTPAHLLLVSRRVAYLAPAGAAGWRALLLPGVSMLATACVLPMVPIVCACHPHSGVRCMRAT